MPTDKAFRMAMFRELLKEQEGLFKNMMQGYGGIIERFSMPHWLVLMGVWDAGGKVTQTQAKKFITVDGFRSDTKRRELVKELRDAKLVRKYDDEDDERVKWIELTEDARIQIEQYLLDGCDVMEEKVDSLRAGPLQKAAS